MKEFPSAPVGEVKKTERKLSEWKEKVKEWEASATEQERRLNQQQKKGTLYTQLITRVL